LLVGCFVVVVGLDSDFDVEITVGATVESNRASSIIINETSNTE